MKYLYLSLLLLVITGCVEQPRIVKLETSKVVPLKGTAVLFNHNSTKDKDK